MKKSNYLLLHLVEYLTPYGIYFKYCESGQYIEMEEMDENSKYKNCNRKNNNVNYLISNDCIYLIDFPHSKYNRIVAYFFSLKYLIREFTGDMFFISENSGNQFRMKISIEKNSNFYKWCLMNYKDIFNYPISSSNYTPDIHLSLEMSKIQKLDHSCKFIDPLLIL
jgi:hypothetical protein